MNKEKILDWNKYIDKAAEAVSEGIVLLRNENNALPLNTNDEIAIFGRIQLHYYKSGTGSGGLVNVSRVVGIPDGLKEYGAKINERLLDVYKKWDEENPFDIGKGWGQEPWSQKEMPIDDTLAKEISEKCDTAVCIIGRTAGEEQDSTLTHGSYLLSEGENQMLEAVRNHFKKVIVILNVGGIIDMSFVNDYSPDAVMYVWQGGMTGGLGVAQVLMGKSPCGKLPDTIAYSVKDYPSDPYFGDTTQNCYCEDIYLGYRYFETFAPERVMYPFGCGLSYTSFEIKVISSESNVDHTNLKISVRNIGSFSGKEVIQLYCNAPQGKLGKPLKILCGFEKTKTLSPDEVQILSMTVPHSELASYDDSGITGYKSCYVLEAGQYTIYAGTDVRSCKPAANFIVNETKVIRQCTQALSPVIPFERIKPVAGDNGYDVSFEPVPMMDYDEEQRRLSGIPNELPPTDCKNLTLKDVRCGKCTMDEFIAQLSDYDLSCIIRGEGMGSPKVTAGTASAFGGMSDELTRLGIPCGCCSDGPSGMRLDCGTKAFSLPNGTLLASTFNKELVQELYTLMGQEMRANNVDCLLGPGMNIHRHPLNGRNFEYFSEDPYLTGHIAAAQLNGLHSEGVTGTVKHFCCNNQETNRHGVDAAVSERALREIYLRGFEIAVKYGNAKSIMTTYGSLNGLWTAANYDLTTTILRNEWGFRGIVMTDWWANINERGKPVDKQNFAAMARAQNDIYMVCANGAENDDNTLDALKSGKLTRAELQRNASNICEFLINTHAMDRLCGENETVRIINRPDESSADTDSAVVFYELDKTIEIVPEGISTDKGESFIFALDVKELGLYRITLTCSSELSELAQLPVTVFSMGTPCGSHTFNGTDGKPVSFECSTHCFSRFTTIRIYFGQSGLTLHSIKFQLAD